MTSPRDGQKHALDFEMLGQPDDASCGPTCLHAVYRHFGDDIPLEDVIAQVKHLEGGGTLAVSLASHALRRGYTALIYTYNLTVFDPSWFEGKPVDLSERLRAQAKAKRSRKLAEATESYLEYLSLGGEFEMEDLTPGLLRRWLNEDRPLLTGLSSTFLYRTPREIGTDTLAEDDVRGVPTGHFVVLCGWDPEERAVRIADPYAENPRFQRHIYWLPAERVINSILLGVLTYDANILLLAPPVAEVTSS